MQLLVADMASRWNVAVACCRRESVVADCESDSVWVSAGCSGKKCVRVYTAVMYATDALCSVACWVQRCAAASENRMRKSSQSSACTSRSWGLVTLAHAAVSGVTTSVVCVDAVDFGMRSLRIDKRGVGSDVCFDVVPRVVTGAGAGAGLHGWYRAIQHGSEGVSGTCGSASTRACSTRCAWYSARNSH